MRHLTALSRNIGVFTRVSSKAVWLHRGRTSVEHRQLNPEEQGGQIAVSPLLTQGLTSCSIFKTFFSLNFSNLKSSSLMVI